MTASMVTAGTAGGEDEWIAEPFFVHEESSQSSLYVPTLPYGDNPPRATVASGNANDGEAGDQQQGENPFYCASCDGHIESSVPGGLLVGLDTSDLSRVTKVPQLDLPHSWSILLPTTTDNAAPSVHVEQSQSSLMQDGPSSGIDEGFTPFTVYTPRVESTQLMLPTPRPDSAHNTADMGDIPGQAASIVGSPNGPQVGADQAASVGGTVASIAAHIGAQNSNGPYVTVGDSLVPIGVVMGARGFGGSQGTASAYVIGDRTVPAGVPVTIQGTPLIVQTAAGRTELAVGTNTVTFAGSLYGQRPSITIHGVPYPAGPNGEYVIEGQTLIPGATVTIGSGESATTVALQSSGDITSVIVNGWTSVLPPSGPISAMAGVPPLLTVGSHTFSANQRTEYVVAPGTTLTPGGVVLVDGTRVSLTPGATALVVGTATVPLLPSATASPSAGLINIEDPLASASRPGSTPALPTASPTTDSAAAAGAAAATNINMLPIPWVVLLSLFGLPTMVLRLL
ncbi:hypothetical protein BDY21DRAFT_164678 [Lineolata rhizophorae]|uniref:Uncharacterized protein n=1 Tax=Lineolata rhizophorae TaxID=578093 RepID=A0A6A6P978_9PEZI|nr:hypothetical protein BDY21DRAFT_164678 [Lineolata rhizophorae]